MEVFVVRDGYAKDKSDKKVDMGIGGKYHFYILPNSAEPWNPSEFRSLIKNNNIPYRFIFWFCMTV